MATDSSLTATVLDGKLKAFPTEYSVNNHRATSQKSNADFMVDLDAERGRPPRKDKENKHRVAIKFAKKVQLATVRAYLDGKIDFDNGVLEGISMALSIFPFAIPLLILSRLP